MTAMMRRPSAALQGLRRARQCPGDNSAMHAGVLFASLAYTLWGLFPLYFKLLAAVPAFEIVLHRSLWSLVVLLIVLAVLRRWAWLPQAARRPRELAVFALSAVLLSAN